VKVSFGEKLFPQCTDEKTLFSTHQKEDILKGGIAMLNMRLRREFLFLAVFILSINYSAYSHSSHIEGRSGPRWPKNLLWSASTHARTAAPTRTLHDVEFQRDGLSVLLTDSSIADQDLLKLSDVHVAFLSGWAPTSTPGKGREWNKVRRAFYRENAGAFGIEHLIDYDPKQERISTFRIIEVLRTQSHGEAFSVRVSGESRPVSVIEPVEIERNLLSTHGDAARIVSCILYWPASEPLWRIRIMDETGYDYVVKAATGDLISMAKDPDITPASPVAQPGRETLSPKRPPTNLPNLRQQDLFEDRSAFLINVPNELSPMDMNVPAAVAAACHIYSAKPVILFTDSIFDCEEHEWFLEDYAPGQIFAVGCYVDPSSVACPVISVQGEPPSEVAANLAYLGWSASSSAVLTDSEDYKAALCAPPLCKRLQAPLLYFEGENLPQITSDCLSALGAEDVFVIGNCPPTVLNALIALGCTVEILPDAGSVAEKMEEEGQVVDYVAMTNPSDRNGGLVPKLSLLSCVLAAHRNGVVLPLEYDAVWKQPYYCTDTTTTQPDGAVVGQKSLYAWWITSTPPTLEPGFVPEFHPVNGQYGYGNVLGWGRNPFCLGASTDTASLYDLALIDLDDNKVYGPGELFSSAEYFSFYTPQVGERTYRIDTIGGSEKWWEDRGYMLVSFLTWKTGTAQIEGMDYPFLLTSLGFGQALGYYDVVQIDSNRDGDFGDAGEEPRFSGEPVTVGSLQYAPTIGVEDYKTAGDLKLTYPSKEEISQSLSDFYSDHLDHPPEYLAIVGYHTALPFGITYCAYEGTEDLPTDYYYGDYDDDPFVDLGIGRIIGENHRYASGAVARSVAYDDIFDPANACVLSIDRGLGFGNEAIRQMGNVGYTGAVCRDPIDVWSDDQMENKTAILHDNHAGSYGWVGGPVCTFHNRLSPCVAASAGCSTASLDFTSPVYSIINRFFQCGAICYAGNTRNASNPGYSYHSMFWAALSADAPLGKANLAALNHQRYICLEEGDAPTASQVACYEAVMFGDPAVRLAFLQPPAVAAARMEKSMAGDEAYYIGPGEWWEDSIEAQYQYSAPGVYFVNDPMYLYHFANVPIPYQTELESVVQLTSLPSPLGWTGYYFVDQQADGEDAVLWRIRVKDYNRTTGEIYSETDYVEYLLNITSEFPRTLYVDAVSPCPGIGSEANPYCNIQTAINNSLDGDTIIVRDGAYTGASNKNLDFSGKAITLRSENGPENCIINCEGDGRGFYFHTYEGPASVVKGFTVRNGYASGSYPTNSGGAILCVSASPTLENLILIDNTATTGGGIFCVEGSSPAIRNSRLSGNYGDFGGAIRCMYSSSPTLYNCEVTANSAYSHGGGISCEIESSPIITACNISNNWLTFSGGYGGGLDCYYYSSPTLTNCTIAGNSANKGGGIRTQYYSSPRIRYCSFSNNSAEWGGGIGCYYNCSVTIENCVLWNDSAVNGPEIAIFSTTDPSLVSVANSDVKGGQPAVYLESGCTLDWGAGNIDADPLFAGGGDYHLTGTSPCIDAGTDAGVYDDIDGDLRPRGAGFDIGADEYYEVSMKLEPDAATVERGGTLGYDVTLTNHTATTLTFKYLTNVTLPNGSPYPPSGALLGPKTIMLAPYASRSAHLTHLIPMSTPLGTYTYNAYIGVAPPTPMNERHFDFEVAP